MKSNKEIQYKAIQNYGISPAIQRDLRKIPSRANRISQNADNQRIGMG